MDIYVGADISKGYADFAISDGEGQIRKELQLDDTRRGHDRAVRLMRELNKRAGKEEELVVGMEATGGMEANWLQLFEDLSEELDLTVYRLNALVLRKFAEQQLHGSSFMEARPTESVPAGSPRFRAGGRSRSTILFQRPGPSRGFGPSRERRWE